MTCLDISTKTPFKPRRSVLYIPGSNKRALEKARQLPADCLIFDLEDAVSPDMKEVARAEILNQITRGGYDHREIIIRVNSLDSIWGEDDLRQMAQSGADAILLPKVNTAKRVKKSIDLLERFEAPEHLDIWCMMETPKGIINAANIAKVHPRVTTLVLGNEDLANDLYARPDQNRTQLLYAMSACIVAARAYGCNIIDGVYTDIHNEEGLRAISLQALHMGFDGKTVIHPKNIEIVNQVFSPTKEEIDQAQELIEAHKKAEENKQAVTLYKGKLVEKLHVRQAQRILSLSQFLEN